MATIVFICCDHGQACRNTPVILQNIPTSDAGLKLKSDILIRFIELVDKNG